MKQAGLFLFLGVATFVLGTSLLASCTAKDNPPESKTAAVPAASTLGSVAKTLPQSSPKDKILGGIVRAFEQADAVHREAWWVVAGQRPPFGKSPFGKVHRALLSFQDIKLTNKSAFRCDRYVVRRDVLSALGYPQNAEIFEKCNDKEPVKKIAAWSLQKVGHLKVSFFPENMEEVLGLGATILVRQVECQMEFNDKDQLTLFRCNNWVQERDKTQLVRLDTYEYHKDKKSLLKLRGKVYENLTELRKIEVDIPLEGKIKLTETELFAPEEIKAEVVAPVTPPGVPAPVAPPGTALAPQSGQAPQAGGTERTVDPDLLRMQGGLQAPEEAVQEMDFYEGEEPPVEGVPHEGPGLLMGPEEDFEIYEVPNEQGLPAEVEPPMQGESYGR